MISDLDTKFYKKLYDDLKHMDDKELINHYNKNGQTEKRIISKNDFFKRYPNFSIKTYKILHDLNKLDDIDIIKDFNSKNRKNYKIYFHLIYNHNHLNFQYNQNHLNYY